ncbi:DNA helicase [Tanacetum coccineum]
MKRNVSNASHLDISDGNIGEPDETDTENLSLTPVAEDLQKKVIVCPKNETADTINSHVLSLLNHECRVYPSSDEATPHGNDGGETELLYPNEYLNTLKFAGLPPHALELKVGASIILLRNLNLTSGLCNGTRMIITQLSDRVIEARIITGTWVSKKVFLSRILLINRDLQMSFVFKRKQFPVKLSYAMTINKSQGQSLEKIGVFLPELVFAHGQLTMAEPSEIQSKADKRKLVLFKPEIINLQDITLATQPTESEKKKRKITPKIKSGPLVKIEVTKRLTYSRTRKSSNMAGDTTQPKESTLTFQCSVLTSTNYTIWSMRIKALLRIHGVWDVIDPGLADATKNNIVKGLSFQSILEDLVLQIGNFNTGKEMWEWIKTGNLGVDRVKEARLQTLITACHAGSCI